MGLKQGWHGSPPHFPERGRARADDKRQHPAGQAQPSICLQGPVPRLVVASGWRYSITPSVCNQWIKSTHVDLQQKRWQPMPATGQPILAKLGGLRAAARTLVSRSQAVAQDTHLPTVYGLPAQQYLPQLYARNRMLDVFCIVPG